MPEKKVIRVGSRKSPLAIRQSELVIAQLKAIAPELEFEIIGISTSGDRDQKSNLSEIGGKGIFVKEVELALLERKIDFAVHSLKDLPALLPEGLQLAAYPKRANPLDCIVYSNGKANRLSDFAAVQLGTGSARRIKQLKLLSDQIETVAIRGRIETRIDKMKSQSLDGIVLACAGLERMGYLSDLTVEVLPAEKFVPSPGQGILAVECRLEDENMAALLSKISDPETAQMAQAERQFLAWMNGNCELPLGALAEKQEKNWIFHAFLAKSESDPGRSLHLIGSDPLALAIRAYEELIK